MNSTMQKHTRPRGAARMRDLAAATGKAQAQAKARAQERTPARTVPVAAGPLRPGLAQSKPQGAPQDVPGRLHRVDTSELDAGARAREVFCRTGGQSAGHPGRDEREDFGLLVMDGLWLVFGLGLLAAIVWLVAPVAWQALLSVFRMVLPEGWDGLLAGLVAWMPGGGA